MAMVTVGPVAVRLRSTGISRQRAAAATLQVFTVAEGQVARDIVFADPAVFEAFQLPERFLPASLRRER